jgi:hypothetical protein
VVIRLESFPKNSAGTPEVALIDAAGIPKRIADSDYHQWKSMGPDELHQVFVNAIRSNTGAFARALMKKRWSVIFSEDPVFMTTDVPVAMFNREREPFGYATPGTTVTFALSPTRVLICDDHKDEPDGQYYPLGPHGAAPANGVAWSHAERFMISPRSTDLVCAELVALADLLDANTP